MRLIMYFPNIYCDELRVDIRETIDQRENIYFITQRIYI